MRVVKVAITAVGGGGEEDHAEEGMTETVAMPMAPQSGTTL